MEKLNTKGSILMETESLISRSCAGGKMTKNFQMLHQQIVKKHYNAAEVSIDYHRKRVAMDIVMNDSDFNPKKANLNLPVLHANLLFKNICDFLKSCLDKDRKSIAFYASLLQAYRQTSKSLTVA